MDYNSKYTGQEVEQLLDQVAGGETSTSWEDITDKPTFAEVATSGDYSDLTNKPTIPDISGKQDKLVSGTNIKTINGTSLLGSGNIVISGGGGGGGSSAYSEVSHGTSDTTFTLTPNVFHIWDEVSSLTLTLGDETAGIANEFLFQFTSGATVTTLTLPNTIKWANDSAPTIEANKIYQVSILKGLASVLVFENTQIIENKITMTTITELMSYSFTAQYPVTSAITINTNYGSTWEIAVGGTTTTLDLPPEFATEDPVITSISPAQDDTYIYTW